MDHFFLASGLIGWRCGNSSGVTQTKRERFSLQGLTLVHAWSGALPDSAHVHGVLASTQVQIEAAELFLGGAIYNGLLDLRGRFLALLFSGILDLMELRGTSYLRADPQGACPDGQFRSSVWALSLPVR
ncbi:MAG: hypothetical protein MZV63_40395 [Marinilabiliales bacterium]|nr:hypothetical protein [Marinilabiliales bacterium]